MLLCRRPRQNTARSLPARATVGALLLLVVCFLVSLSPPSRAETATKASTPSAPEVLPELPEVPDSRFGRPDEDAVAELKEHLQRVRSPDAVVRERAVREVLEAKPSWVPAIYHRLNQLADHANREGMKEKLRKIRNRARDAVREKMRRAGEHGKVVTPDYLQMVAEYAAPDDEDWQALVSVLAMSRMLVAVGNVQATRALIQIYVRFGEFLRVDTQLQLDELGEKAAAALIEARKHPAAKIAHWANRQLDQMGKAIPSELVQTEDQQVLADVLRAYGRIQDPDAARIIISFANSERAQIRLAARQGVRMMGEIGNWQLRDTYQNIVGKNPPRDWSWKRVAQELFHEFDRLRLAHVQRLFKEGMAAQKKGDWEAMRKAFDRALANNPMLDRRDEMVDGYVTYARRVADEKLEDAILAARRAERINSDPKKQAALESLRLTLEGEQLLARGLADQLLFRRALELDSTNQRAREEIAMIERGERIKQPEYSRYYGAAAIGGVALLAILLIVFFRPKGPEGETEASRSETHGQKDGASAPGSPGTEPSAAHVQGLAASPEEPVRVLATSAPEGAASTPPDAAPDTEEAMAASEPVLPSPGEPITEPHVVPGAVEAAASEESVLPEAPVEPPAAVESPDDERTPAPKAPGEQPDSVDSQPPGEPVPGEPVPSARTPVDQNRS